MNDRVIFCLGILVITIVVLIFFFAPQAPDMDQAASFAEFIDDELLKELQQENLEKEPRKKKDALLETLVELLKEEKKKTK